MSFWGVSLQLLNCSPAHWLRRGTHSQSPACPGRQSFPGAKLADCWSRTLNVYKHPSYEDTASPTPAPSPHPTPIQPWSSSALKCLSALGWWAGNCPAYSPREWDFCSLIGREPDNVSGVYPIPRALHIASESGSPKGLEEAISEQLFRNRWEFIWLHHSTDTMFIYSMHQHFLDSLCCVGPNKVSGVSSRWYVIS